jgi:hypothetical protein
MEEWRLLASGDFSDSDETSPDDGRPRTHTKPSKSKWSATKANAQIKSSLKLLKDRKKEALFRALRLLDSINWLKLELMKGKTLEDTELQANTAGTCGLSALTCLETSRTHAGKIHTICKSLPPLTDASKEDVAALKAWRDDICAEADKWLAHVQVRSDVGAKLSAALFNKETDFIRQQLAKTPQLTPARSILLHSSPTLTRLFLDDARVIKARRPLTSTPKSPYNSSRGYKPRGAGAVTSTSTHQGQKPNQRQKAKAAKSPAKKLGNPKGRPHHLSSKSRD